MGLSTGAVLHAGGIRTGPPPAFDESADRALYNAARADRAVSPLLEISSCWRRHSKHRGSCDIFEPLFYLLACSQNWTSYTCRVVREQSPSFPLSVYTLCIISLFIRATLFLLCRLLIKLDVQSLHLPVRVMFT